MIYPKPKQAKRSAHRLRELSPLSHRGLDSVAASPEARLLLEEITATPREDSVSSRAHTGRGLARTRLRPKRLAWVAGAAAAAAAVVATLPGLFGSDSGTAAAGVRFETRGEYIIARVTDPFAAEDELNAAFEAEDLEISLSLQPVSPSLVGTVIFVEDSGRGEPIEAINGGRCVTGGGVCPIGLRIPRDYSGHGQIALGRPAAADEEYDSSVDAFAPGEALHCAGKPGSTVGALLPALEANYEAIEWRDRGEHVLEPAPPHDHVVTSVIPLSSDAAIVRTGSEPGDATRHSTPAYRAALTAGC